MSIKENEEIQITNGVILLKSKKITGVYIKLNI